MSEGFVSRGFGGRRRKQSVGRGPPEPPAPCSCTEELDGRILRPLPYSGPDNISTLASLSSPTARRKRKLRDKRSRVRELERDKEEAPCLTSL